ncbi:MAG: putative lipoprotein [Betaproteobacteria bacterium]|nr:putative lipoprotein [Betaproteobacteria bacterium]
MRAARYVWIAWLCLCVFTAMNGVCAADQHPIPEPTGLLVDQVGALTDAEREAIAARLKTIQDAGHAQVAILIANGIEGEPPADYALRVAEKWELGRAQRDDGVLVLVIPSATAARIEVGYGLEGVIPDARASQWLDELLPAIKKKEFGKGLDHLLDQIEGVLPSAKTNSNTENYLFPDHPEWRLPFVLVVFSPFALFPLFFGRWGSFASGPLLAAFFGGAAWALWQSAAVAFAVAAVALPLPFLWGLNWWEREELGRGLRYGRTFGNLIGVALFFSVIALFVGAGVSAMEPDAVWVGPMFAGLLSVGLAIFLFPGKPAHYLMIVLRSAMQFVFILVVAAVALEPFIPHPGRIAFAAAALVTACIALGLYLDSRERACDGGTRWSLWFFGLALLLALPFGVLALLLAAGGEDFHTRLVQAAAGSGSIAAVLALAARVGLIAAVRIGLGGRFGGGGAGRSE